MTTFKIRDLAISLEPGWCDEEHRKKVMFKVTCPRSDPVKIQRAPGEELAALKRQLQEAMAALERREAQLQPGPGEAVLETASAAELVALEGRLSEALAHVRSKIGKPRKPARKSTTRSKPATRAKR